MQNRCIKSIVFLGALWALVWPVHAEIYKWVDKDGTIRYTDTPPPMGVKPISKIGKKSAPATFSSTSSENPIKPATDGNNQTQKIEKNSELTPEALAKKKRDMEEIAKKNKAELEAQAKKKELNCATAKTNYQTYSQGGRIYKTNENGEREYIDSSGMAEGLAQAQRDIQEYCN